MSEIVLHGGASQQESDNCYGSRERILAQMKRAAPILIGASPIIAAWGAEYLKDTPYGRDISNLKDIFAAIIQMLEEASNYFGPQENQCHGPQDVFLWYFGIKQCDKGTAAWDGIFAAVAKFFAQSTELTRLLTRLTGLAGIHEGARRGISGIEAVWTTLTRFVANMLTDLLCLIYTIGQRGPIGTWVIAKSIIGTIVRFISSGGVISYNVAIGIGGALLKYFTRLGRWNDSSGEFLIANDTPSVEEIEANGEEIDNEIFVDAVGEETDEPYPQGVLTALSETVENLEYTENYEDGGDEIIQEYKADSEMMASDFIDNDENLKFIKKYLKDAIKLTAKGGLEYKEHVMLLENINKTSGRWRPATDMYDMGDASEMAASQPMFDEFDDEFDTSDTLTRYNTSGGIIKKEDAQFIKNLGKSMKKLRNEDKSKNKTNKAGWKYNKHKNSKKRPKQRRLGAGLLSNKRKMGKGKMGKGKMGKGKMTKGKMGKGKMGKRRMTKRRDMKIGWG
jgi:hypothetical protein